MVSWFLTERKEAKEGGGREMNGGRWRERRMGKGGGKVREMKG